MSVFPACVIPASVLSTLPEGYTCRPLRQTDYSAGFLELLQVLTKVGDISPEAFEKQIAWLRGRNGTFTSDELDVVATAGAADEDDEHSVIGAIRKRALEEGEYFVLCITDDKGVIVGTGTLLVERKFIHELGKVGHLEDIVVAKNQQGKRLGLWVIQALENIAKQAGCYKSILDCSDANEGFYVKCGFKRCGLYMAHYYN